MDEFEKYTSPDATIYYGDCLTALLDVPDESVDLVFADPPDHEHADPRRPFVEIK